MALKTTVQVRYWGDIPVLVKAKKGRARFSIEMPHRFRKAIESAAEAAGLDHSDPYNEQYFWTEPKIVEGAPEDIAKALVIHLEAAHPEIDWKKTADSILEQQNRAN